MGISSPPGTQRYVQIAAPKNMKNTRLAIIHAISSCSSRICTLPMIRTVPHGPASVQHAFDRGDYGGDGRRDILELPEVDCSHWRSADYTSQFIVDRNEETRAASPNPTEKIKAIWPRTPYVWVRQVANGRIRASFRVAEARVTRESGCPISIWWQHVARWRGRRSWCAEAHSTHRTHTSSVWEVKRSTCAGGCRGGRRGRGGDRRGGWVLRQPCGRRRGTRG